MSNVVIEELSDFEDEASPEKQYFDNSFMKDDLGIAKFTDILQNKLCDLDLQPRHIRARSILSQSVARPADSGTTSPFVNKVQPALSFISASTAASKVQISNLFRAQIKDLSENG